MASFHCSASSAFKAARYVFGPCSIIMAMLTLAAVLPLVLGIGVSGCGVSRGVVSGGGVSGGGVSGGCVRSSSKSSIGLIARGNAAAFEGFTLAFGDCIIAFGTLGGSSSISKSLSCSAGSKANFVGLVCSNW